MSCYRSPVPIHLITHTQWACVRVRNMHPSHTHCQQLLLCRLGVVGRACQEHQTARHVSHCVQHTHNTQLVNKYACTHARTHARKVSSSCSNNSQYSRCAFKAFDLPAHCSSAPAVFSPTAKFHRFIAVVCSCSAAARCSRLSKSSAGTLLTRSSARSASAGELSPPWLAVSSFSKAVAQGKREQIEGEVQNV